MAVFQISRIQIRRGQANNGTGIPQLASGEMAWAVDTQQLFIGNGAVSEGSPAVGNTRVLTAVDLTSAGNLLSIAEYAYQAAPTSTTRTLQSRLDDQVSTLDFGVTGSALLIDPNDINSGYAGTDDTAALQYAINQMYLNQSNLASSNNGPEERVKLNIPAGVYLISGPIYIPSYTTLIGDGVDKTIIYYNPSKTVVGSAAISTTTFTTTAATLDMVGATVSGTGISSGTTVTAVVPGVSLTLSVAAIANITNAGITVVKAGAAFTFVNDTSTPGHPSVLGSTLYVNQPRYIRIQGMTIHTPSGTNTCMQLDAVRDSLFVELKLQGDWTHAGTPNPNSAGVVMTSLSTLVTCQSNTFRNITFSNFYYGAFAKGDVLNNIFENCRIESSRQGFSLGTGSNGVTVGQQQGPRNTTISNCDFYDVKQQAVYIERGLYNNVVNCRLANVGNNGGGNVQAAFPQVYFKTYGNSIVNTQSDRSADLATNNMNTPYLPELGGAGRYTSYASKQQVLQANISPVLLFRLPVSTDASGVPTGTIRYAIEYFYKSTISPSTGFSRSGTLSIVADLNGVNIQLSDDYEFSGSDPSNTNALMLDFSAGFMTQTGITYTGANGQIPSGIALYYLNTMSSDIGYIEYSYTAII